MGKIRPPRIRSATWVNRAPRWVNAAAGHLIAALKKYKLPQAEIDELVGLVAGTANDRIKVKD